jgi:uncharacterized membrane protein YbhN (UPF0104 family)
LQGVHGTPQGTQASRRDVGVLAERPVTGSPRARHRRITEVLGLQRKRGVMRAIAIAALTVLVVVCVLRRDALCTAIAAVPPSALLALAALHLCALAARSEAWRLSLGAIGGSAPARATIHTASAGAFVAGALQPHAALPARVALLRRIAPDDTPHPAHVAVADVPIFLLEVAGAAALLAVTGAWWARRLQSRLSWARASPPGAAPPAAWRCSPTSAAARRSRCSSGSSSPAASGACGSR